GHYLLQGDARRVVARMPGREPFRVKPTTQADKRVRSSRHRGPLQNAVRWISRNVGDQTRDRRHVDVVKDDHPTYIEHLVDIKEIDQRVVEGLKAIDDRRLDPGLRIEQLGQRYLGRCLNEIDETLVTGPPDIGQAHPGK